VDARCIAGRDLKAGSPAGCASAGPRMDMAGSRPALASNHETTEFEFHMSPVWPSSRPQTREGTLGNEIEDLRRSRGVLRHPHGTRDSLRDVGDDAVSPSTDLVPEQTEASDEFRSDDPLRDHSPPFTVMIGDRGLFDHEAARRSDYHESRVIKVARTSSLNT
jgi:hypothetical protein